MAYLKYTLGILIRPRRAMKDLVADPHRFRIGLFAVLTLGILYAVTAFRLYFNGVAAAGPFLRLPVDSYYLYEGFFMLPVALASWLLAGSTIYLTVSGIERTYKDVLAVLGLPYGILVLPLMWLPETIVAFCWPTVWSASGWTTLTPVRVVLGTVWVFMGCVLAVKELYGLSFLRSLLPAFASLVVGLGVSVIFIR